MLTTTWVYLIPRPFFLTPSVPFYSLQSSSGTPRERYLLILSLQSCVHTSFLLAPLSCGIKSAVLRERSSNTVLIHRRISSGSSRSRMIFLLLISVPNQRKSGAQWKIQEKAIRSRILSKWYPPHNTILAECYVQVVLNRAGWIHQFISEPRRSHPRRCRTGYKMGGIDGCDRDD